MKRRILFVDAARALAIALALFAHAMVTFGGWFEPYTYLRLLTRTATPLFLLMFGMMLEIVYVPRAARDGLRGVSRRLLVRSAQCYFGYVLTVVAAVVGGYLSLKNGLFAAVLLGKGHFGNILRFYTVALLVAPVLIWLRSRLDHKIALALVALIWIVEAMLLNGYSASHLDIFRRWAGLVFGVGPMGAGPSLWHGFTFVFVGMLLGFQLRHGQGVDLKPFYRTSGWVLLVTLAVVGYLVATLGSSEVASGYMGFGFRSSNHVGYYAIGLVACVVVLLLLSTTLRETSEGAERRVILVLGRRSLASYTVGNVLLNLIPESVLGSGFGWMALPLAILFIVAILLIMSGYEQVEEAVRLRARVDSRPA